MTAHVEAEPNEPTLNPAPAAQSKSVRWACTSQVLMGWIAAILSAIDVESIIGTFLLLIATGVTISTLANRRASWQLMYFGFSGLWIVALNCLIIAIFDLGPSEATPTVPILLFAYSLLITFWIFPVRKIPESLIAKTNDRPAFQFSMRSVMYFTTLVCVLMTIGNYIPWRKEELIFGAVGITLLGISGLIAFRFSQKLTSASPTPDKTPNQP